jgi:hypothetical protein
VPGERVLRRGERDRARALKLTKALTAPNWLKQYAVRHGFTLFTAFAVLRKLGLT